MCLVILVGVLPSSGGIIEFDRITLTSLDDGIQIDLSDRVQENSRLMAVSRRKIVLFIFMLKDGLVVFVKNEGKCCFHFGTFDES